MHPFARSMWNFATVIILLLCQPLIAQPLADRVPADALIYVGWAGAEKAVGYDASHLKAVLEAWQPLKKVDEVVTAALRNEPTDDAQEAWNRFRTIVPLLYQHPTALYFGGVDYGPKGQPPKAVRVAVICDAGEADAAKIQQALQPLIDDAVAHDADPLPKLTVNNGIVVFHVGDLPGDVAARLGVAAGASAAAPLAEQGDFKAAVQQTGLSNAAAIVYVNVPGLLEVFDRGMQINESPEDVANWRKARDTLGLTGIKRVIWSGGFDGADWQTASWIESPTPRRGVAALLAAPALDQKVVASVPRTAQWLIAARFDLNQVWQLIRELTATMDPDAVADLDEHLAQAQQQIGVKLEDGLIKPLGDQWLVYGEPTMTTPFGPGAMVVNFTRDGQTLADSLKKLMDFANAMLQQDAQQPGGPRLSVQQMQSEGATIHYLAVPFVSPALAVHDGKLYFALSPQTISMKIAMSQVQVTPIAEHPDFKAVMQKLGDHPSQAIVFADLKQTAPVMLQSIANLVQMAQMQAPGDVNLMRLIPNVADLMPHLGPVGQVAWTDDSGIHGRSRSPFPLSSTLSPVGGTASPAFVAVAAGLALPAVAKAREAARTAQSQNNLKMIGLAAHNWAEAQGGGDKLPPSLSAMVQAGMLEPQSLSNPRVGDPGQPEGGEDALEAWIRDHSGYVYIGGGKTFRGMKQGTANTPIAYERLVPALGDRVSVLYADGHVEALPRERAMEVLREAGVTID